MEPSKERIQHELVRIRKMQEDMRLITGLCSQILVEVQALKERFDILNNADFLKQQLKEQSKP